MTDIVERLRQPCHPDEPPSGVDLERRRAADMIEWLRHIAWRREEAAKMQAVQIKRLRAALREIERKSQHWSPPTLLAAINDLAREALGDE